jgi:DNA adenine methylase
VAVAESRNQSVAEDRVVLSPLRYPGGKRRLVPYVRDVLEANDLKPCLFVEPFAGGSSVALELAFTGAVSRIGLFDRDPLVAAFWKVVFWDTDWLCDQVQERAVDLATWEKLKFGKLRSNRDRAFACLFLNRTSFNGSLNERAGPIGGKAQAGDYPLDCRFPRKRLEDRIRACAALAAAGKVDFVRADSALSALGWVTKNFPGEETFFYLDPPFWAKSQRLYRHAFAPRDHKALASALRYVRQKWLLSYDPAPEVVKLYEPHKARRARIELLYTGTQRSAGKEIVISNLVELPPDTRLWRTEAEWKGLRSPGQPAAAVAEDVELVSAGGRDSL